MALACGDRAIEWAPWAAGERNDARRLAFQPFKPEPRRFIRWRIEEGARVEPHQAAITLGVRCEQHDARLFRPGVRGARPMLSVAKIDGECAADKSLDAVAREPLGGLQRPEH